MRQPSIKPRCRSSAVGIVSLAALAMASLPSAAGAQTLGYEGDAAGQGTTAATGSAGAKGARGGRHGQGSRHFDVRPYIEVDQIVDAELSPGSDIVTYTQVAAGLDVGIAGRNNAVSASIRYERQFGWGSKASDGDAISGIARGYATVVPGVTIEAGGLATQSSLDGRGAALSSGRGADNGRTSIYSVYAGPSVSTQAGDMAVSANYRAGFTKIDRDATATGGSSIDVFDKSVTQVADFEAGVAPGTVLPVGLGVAASGYQEDISNLDQRVRDLQARALVTVPVGRTVQVTGAIGYEDVEISSRDAVRDASGNPVVGSDGRYVTDKSSPRVLAYDVSGLIWDAAVMWRPGRRTSLSAHVGRRYGTTSYGGTLTYAPNERSQFSLVVYDNVAGFGGQINRLLDELPDDFEAVRDPVSGDLTGCVATLQGNNCFAGVLGSLRSSTFRARGVAGSFALKLGGLDAGVGLGYDRRKFIAAPGTVLAAANGVIDENTWLAGYLGGRLGRSAGWSTTVHANWLSSNDPLLGDVTEYGAAASYYRMLTQRLQATLAMTIDGTSRDDAAMDDIWTASALAGLRYNF